MREFAMAHPYLFTRLGLAAIGAAEPACRKELRT